MNLTDKEKELFSKLRKKRKKYFELSKDPDYIGQWDNLVKGIYSDEAHFIYELIQNAEDVKASIVKFILEDKGLYFIHNGNIHFSLTDVDNQKENGHINAITAIGRTGKKISDTIGKFGIGFKSVFQYTLTPHIYDPKFHFRINDYIVPTLLSENVTPSIKYDKGKETVFYFPFVNENDKVESKRVKKAVKAFSDIYEKLLNLDKPTLFLKNLKEISYEIKLDDKIEASKHSKQLKESKSFDPLNIQYEHINLPHTNEDYLMFSRTNSDTFNNENIKYTYSVCFKLNDKKLQSYYNSKAYCYFITKENTNLNFLINGSFLLNSNRESIPSNLNLTIKNEQDEEIILKEKFNEFLLSQIAYLAADSLLILRDMKLIDDNIFDIIPYKKPQDDDLFKDFYYKIKEKFQTEELLPSNDGTYVKKENAYWVSVSKITELFSNKQLSYLLAKNESEENDKWVFASKGRDSIKSIKPPLANYIDDIISNWLNEEDILNGITTHFIEQQNAEWLYYFYKWISETEGRNKLAKGKPFFLNKERKAIPSIDANEKSILFLPSKDNYDYETLNNNLFHKTTAIISNNEKLSVEDLANCEEFTKKFFERFGIKEFDILEEVNLYVIPLYSGNNKLEEISENENLGHNVKIAKAIEESKESDRTGLINKLKDLKFIAVKNQKTNERIYQSPSYIYLSEKYTKKRAIESFFEDIEDFDYFLIDDIYFDLYNLKTLKDLGCKDNIDIANEYKKRIDVIYSNTKFDLKNLNTKVHLNHLSYCLQLNFESYGEYYENFKFKSSNQNGISQWKTGSESYFKTNDLEILFGSDFCFIDENLYSSYRNEINKFNINENIKINFNKDVLKGQDITYIVYDNQILLSKGKNGFMNLSDKNAKYNEFKYVRSKGKFDLFTQIKHIEIVFLNFNVQKFKIFWNFIIEHIFLVKGLVQKSNNANFPSTGFVEDFSILGKMLINERWIPDKYGNFYKPSDIRLENIPDGLIEKNSKETKLLCDKLGIKYSKFSEEERNEFLKQENISEKDLQLLNFAKINNITLEDLEKAKSNNNNDIDNQEIFDNNVNSNRDKRDSRIEDEVNNTDPISHEIKNRSVKKSYNYKKEAKIYLKNLYSNNETLICQVCENPDTFKYRDSYYFETVIAFKLNRDNQCNYLLLCPNCSSKFNLMRKNNDFLLYLKNPILDNESQDNKIEIEIDDSKFKLQIDPLPKKIIFSGVHLKDLRKVITSLEDKDILKYADEAEEY